MRLHAWSKRLAQASDHLTLAAFTTKFMKTLHSIAWGLTTS
jgi:hypothetical protein